MQQQRRSLTKADVVYLFVFTISSQFIRVHNLFFGFAVSRKDEKCSCPGPALVLCCDGSRHCGRKTECVVRYKVCFVDDRSGLVCYLSGCHTHNHLQVDDTKDKI